MDISGLFWLILLSSSGLSHGNIEDNDSLNKPLLETLTSPEEDAEELEHVEEEKEEQHKDTSIVNESDLSTDQALTADDPATLENPVQLAVGAHQFTQVSVDVVEVTVSSREGPEVTTAAVDVVGADSREVLPATDVSHHQEEDVSESNKPNQIVRTMKGGHVKRSENTEPLQRDTPGVKPLDRDTPRVKMYDYVRRYLIAAGYMRTLQHIPPGYNLFTR